MLSHRRTLFFERYTLPPAIGAAGFHGCPGVHAGADGAPGDAAPLAASAFARAAVFNCSLTTGGAASLNA